MKRRHVRQQSYRFAEQRITLKDGLIYLIGGMIVFRVNDVYKALFEIDDLDNAVDNIGMAAIRDEVQKLNHKDLEKNEAVEKKLLARIKTRGDEWGVDFIQFSLTDCAPTAETANILNSVVGASLRIRALKAAATNLKISVNKLEPGLAAALIGIPIMATLPAMSMLHPASSKEKKTEESHD